MVIAFKRMFKRQVLIAFFKRNDIIIFYFIIYISACINELGFIHHFFFCVCVCVLVRVCLLFIRWRNYHPCYPRYAGGGTLGRRHITEFTVF